MKSLLHCGARGGFGVLAFLLFGLFLCTPALAEGEESDDPHGGGPMPMPLHSFEGTGGAWATHSAFLVNPAVGADIFGLPSFGYMHVHLGHGKHLECLTVTETLWDRIELGYGLNYMDMGDLPEDIERAFGDTVKIGDHAITMHNFNARVQAVRPGDLGLDWLPTMTVGFHYKVNTTIEDIDDDLNGTLSMLDIEDDTGWDFTLTATKMLDFMPLPTALSVTCRYTEAAHTGLLGFTGDRNFVVEANLCVLVLDDLWLAAEYRQKPFSYDDVPGLLEDEDDWWTIDLAYVANDQLTVAVGYGHFGKLLNHRANKVFGVAVKFEF